MVWYNKIFVFKWSRYLNLFYNFLEYKWVDMVKVNEYIIFFKIGIGRVFFRFFLKVILNSKLV